MPTRLLRLGLAALLLVLLLPAQVGAQNDPLDFPPVSSGEWEGLVNFSGYVSSDSVLEDGSFSVSITDVIGDTSIFFDLTVDDDGNVTTGKMIVDLTYFNEIVGATYVEGTSHPFRVVHDHHQTGTLSISGNADRLVAAGTLTHTTNTNADGDKVEEVSGTESQEVEWVFQAIESTCARVTADLVEATGISLIGTALIPRDTVSEGEEIYNRLELELWAWPADVDDPEEIKEALENVTDRADEISRRDLPAAEHLVELVDTWTDLNAKLAALDVCQTALVGFVPESAKSWLVDIIQDALNKALNAFDDYETNELIDLWYVGAHEEALTPELVIDFLDTFDDKLDEAIADDDIGTITDILVWASAYGFPNLTAKAKAALP